MRQRAAEEAFELSGVRHVSALAFGPVYAGGGMLMYWTHRPQAPWQREDWLSEMRQALRPNQYLRMIENRWVSTESSFVDMAWWDECTDAALRPVVRDRDLAVWVGVDASVKRDSTAIVACTWDEDEKRCRRKRRQRTRTGVARLGQRRVEPLEKVQVRLPEIEGLGRNAADLGGGFGLGTALDEGDQAISDFRAGLHPYYRKPIFERRPCSAAVDRFVVTSRRRIDPCDTRSLRAALARPACFGTYVG